MKTWKNILRNTKLALIHQLKEKDKTIYPELHKEFFAHINKSLDDFLEISDIRDLVEFCVEEENKLFICRITKFVEVSKQHKLQVHPIICSLHNHYPVKYILFIYHTQRNYRMLHLEKSDQQSNQRQL